MKKAKLLLLAVVTALAGTALASCRNNDNVDPNKPNPDNPSGGSTTGQLQNNWDKVKDGFTNIQADINRPDINKPIVIKDGKKIYQVAGLDIEIKETTREFYTQEMRDPKFNYLLNGKATNSEVYANMVDGLYETSRAKKLIGMLAVGEKHDVTNSSEPKFSYQIRKNVPWVYNDSAKQYTFDGKPQFVSAEDFVEAAYYTLTNPKAEAAFVYTLFVKGAEEFQNWASSNKNAKDSEKRAKFAELVGVKSVDNNEVVEYTLVRDIPYFKSVTTYSPYLPVNKHFLAEKGSNFGTTENDILVNGAYRLVEQTKETKRVFQDNPTYWDKEHVYVKRIEQSFYKGGQAVDVPRLQFENGQIDSFVVNVADKEGWNKYVGEGNSPQSPKHEFASTILAKGSSTYWDLFNYGRTKYEFNDGSAPSAESKKATKEALKIVDFRLGFLYGLDYVKTRLTSTKTPEQIIYRRLVNEDLAIDEDGKDYTQYFDEVYNKENKVEGVKLTGSDTGFDPVHNPEKSKEYFKKAAEALKAKNVTLPVRIDVIGSLDLLSKQQEKNRYDLLEQLAKEANDGQDLIKFFINYPQNDGQEQDWTYEYNFDFGGSGWGPDYADPYTFLHTMIINGDFAEYQGLKFNEPKQGEKETDENKATRELAEEILGEITKEVEEANNVNDNVKLRYEKFAQAEYNLIYKYGIALPKYRSNSLVVSVGRTVPFQAAKVSYGLSADRRKNSVVAKNPLTKEQKAKIIKQFYELSGKNIENVTLSFIDPKTGVNFVDFKGVNASLEIEKGTNAILPKAFNDDRKVVRRWFTDQELKKPVDQVNGLHKATESLTLYGKVEDLATVQSISLTGVEGSLAKAVAADPAFTYPLVANDSKGSFTYEFSVDATYSNNNAEDEILRDEIEAEVVAFDSSNELDNMVASHVKALYDPTTKKIVIELSSDSDLAQLKGGKVKVSLTGASHKDTDPQQSRFDLTFEVVGASLNHHTVFPGNENVKVMTTTVSGVTVENKVLNTNFAQIDNQGKLTGLATKGEVELQTVFTLDNDKVRLSYTQDLSFSVLDTLTVGSQYDLSVVGETDLVYESSDSDVAKFEGSVLTVLKAGQTVTITVKKGQTVQVTSTLKTEVDKTRAKSTLGTVLARTEGQKYTKETQDALNAAISDLKAKLEDYKVSADDLEKARKALVSAYLSLEQEK